MATQRKTGAIASTIARCVRQIQQQGDGVSMERISEFVDMATLNRVENLYSVLSDIAANDTHI